LTAGREGRKQFFFEKKNQKTFTLKNKSFLVLFFKKELLSSFVWREPQVLATAASCTMTKATDSRT
jgi:hypothetical protein